MAHDLILLLTQYGLLLVFLNVLIEQVGVPVPAVPTLVVASALAANGQLSLPGVVGVALLACLLGDLLWYEAGRRYGGGVMRILCRISLSPDSCVRQSELRFQRWRGGMLLVAKFIPGLSTVAPPLVGAMGLRRATFLWLDGLGSLLWIAAAAVLGYAFASQIDTLLTTLANAGTIAFELLAALLVLYIAVKWWQRQRLLRALRMARITAGELNRAMTDGDAPVVVDVRSESGRALDSRIIPGALLADPGRVGQMVRGLAPDQELVMYCSCPNEASAAMAAKLLMAAGHRHVRPLLGGLDAWAAAGYPVDHLPASGSGPDSRGLDG
ncbi:MAG TPA: VTT domain-containing protein [Rhodanobacter sp.]|jgi:membrane protein DedA with SNARE-associated domain/rhodanese-related sulfurtransferase|nr:VTT domain-containing protein [Rhodanobacter sp.]